MSVEDGAKHLEEISFQDELGESFGRYAEKVILDRAIPDIRDGLKPVQRRIIYAMHDSGNTADKPYRKAAKTVGDVMGNYHPHGDSSIYDALVRLAQPWKMRYPLVDGHGNFGSMDDDPAAAMRYTEARLSPIASELMRDITKDTVPFRPNFDDKTQEPVVLPSAVLNLLVNGTSGVSAGFATDIPSHNLTEVIDGTLALLKKPALEVADLMEYVTGPDFPTGGIVMGAEGIRDAYEGGKGKVVLRGRHTLEKQRDGKTLIVFSEIPYNIVKSDLVRQMDALRIEKAVQGLLDVRDESDREGLRIVIEVSRNADPEGVLAYLYKKTNLQINYHFNMVTIWRRTPRLVGLKEILQAFIDHRREVITRRTLHDLDRAERRMHDIEGLIKAIDILDEVIATIRRSNDRADARNNLMPLGFTERQADAILDLRLVRLTNLQLLLLTDERDELAKQIAGLKAILGDTKIRDKVVGTELKDIRKRFGDDRRTTIEAEVIKLDVALEVTVKAQDVVVGMTRDGWIKRASMASFHAMGGDRKTAGVRPGDRMHDVLLTNTTHTVLVFSALGHCFPIPVHLIPEGKWGENGTALVNVCGIEKEDRAVEILSREDFPDDRYLLFFTENGQSKATPLSEFGSTRTSGITAMRLADGDGLSRVIETDLLGEILLLTRTGQGIRFSMAQISVQGRSAKGVRAMGVDSGDALVDVALLPKSGEGPTHVGLFTVAGRAKLTPVDQHPRQKRGGKGVRMIIRRSSAPHDCVGLVVCDLRDTVEVVDSAGNEFPVAVQRIPVTRRDGNAWTVVELKGGSRVVLVERFPFVEEEVAAST